MGDYILALIFIVIATCEIFNCYYTINSEEHTLGIDCLEKCIYHCKNDEAFNESEINWCKQLCNR